jgi:2-amino-4-hydroxy-6-hydroxymethyldihydropteridine diphosphokinase
MMNTVYILLGSNIGNSKAQLLLATEKIEIKIGEIIKASSLYATEAWGKKDQPNFINQVLIVETKLEAANLIKTVLVIEKDMGRKRTIKNAPRIIDIDILFFNNEIINTKNLIVPHPEIQNRRFVLVPLVELSPFYMYPSIKKKVSELLIITTDNLNVQKI